MEVVVGDRSTGTPNSLVDRIAVLREQLADACRSAGRDPSSVRLVAVTKAQPRGTVLAAIQAGVEDVAENYAQEAQPKLAGIGTVRKHFIGHVQTNKAKAIVQTFDVVQSIDRIEAGRAIAKAARTLHKPVKALVQVNVSPTERFGAAPDEAPELAERLRAEGLDIEGVMAIGPMEADHAAIREAFRLAAGAFDRVGGSMLSLGMSGDWREAIACGSTMVRLGTAIFGPRGGPNEAEGLFV